MLEGVEVGNGFEVLLKRKAALFEELDVGLAIFKEFIPEIEHLMVLGHFVVPTLELVADLHAHAVR